MSDIAYLLVSSSADPDNTSDPIYLSAQVTRIGRPESGEVQSYIELDDLTVSRKHATITRQGDNYILANWQGRFNIGLYNEVLKYGDKHVLRQGDIFRIPDLEKHYKIIFLIRDKTQVLPFHYDSNTRRFFVFSDLLNLTQKEHTILRYLYEHHGEVCAYDDIIAAVWPEERQGQEIPSRKNDLDVHLSSLRKKIRAASGGFTFIRTLPKRGLQLRVM